MAAILDLEINFDLIDFAIEKERENNLWEVYSLQYPNMNEDTFISFEDYKKKWTDSLNGSKISYEEIEIEMDKVVRSYESGVNRNRTI